MVVIKGSERAIKNLYGKDAVLKLENFADIIGYSIEIQDGELRIELNPDRPDLFSFPTLVKASSNYSSPADLKAPGEVFSLPLSLDPEALKLRPYVYSFTATGNRLGAHFEELIDFQEKIHVTVGKNRKKSSIGIHDRDKITLPASFTSRKSGAVSFTTYDNTVTGTAAQILKKHPKGIEFSALIPPGDSVPLIMDSELNVLSLPPVVNGSVSSIGPDTCNFFVDVTGTDNNACIGSVYLMANFFDSLEYDVSLCAAGTEEIGYNDRLLGARNRNVQITEREIMQFTGASMSPSDVRQTLRRMGYGVSGSSFPMSVKVPPFRVDVMGPADIFEDLAKGIGYDNLEPVKFNLGTVSERNARVEFSNMLRQIMAGAGFQEILTFVIGSEVKYRGAEYTGGIRILNPKSLDYSVVRDRLSLNMLETFGNNTGRQYPQQLFEIGDVIVDGHQRTRIVFSIASSRASFSEIKKVLEYISMRLLNKSPSLLHKEDEILIPGRTGSISFNGITAGIMGEVRPDFLESFSMRVPVALAELDLDALHEMYLNSGPAGKE